MCEAITAATLFTSSLTGTVTVGGALSAAGAIFSLYGTLAGGAAAKAQGKYQQQVARRNAIMAERASEAALAQGRFKASAEGVKNRQLLGLMRTRSTGLGDVNFGSALDLSAGTQEAGATNIELIRRDAERKALGFTTDALNFRSEGQMARLEGDAKFASSITSGFGTILTTAGKTASKNVSRKRPTFRRTSSSVSGVRF